MERILGGGALEHGGGILHQVNGKWPDMKIIQKLQSGLTLNFEAAQDGGWRVKRVEGLTVLFI